MDTHDIRQMRQIRRFFRRFDAKLLLGMVIFTALAYLLLLTPVGNRLVTPLVEKGLSSVLAAPISIDTFELNSNHFHLRFHDLPGNTFVTQGGYSLLTRWVYGYYQIDLEHPLGLNPLAIAFHSSGAYSGRYSLLHAQGEIECVGGTINYKTKLDHLFPSFIRLRIHNLDVQSLLHLLNYPSDTSTTLDGNITLSGFVQRRIEGNIALQTHTRTFTPTPILEDTNESFDLASLLADEKGGVKRFSVNATTDLDLEEAGILEQLLGIRLRGPLKLHAALAGNQHDLVLNARTDLAHSKSRLSLAFQRLQPQHLNFTINHARIEPLFAFLDQKAPVGGIADGSGDFNLTGGYIRLDLRQGVTYPEVLKQEYNLTQPNLAFNAYVTADLSRKGVHYRGSFRSNLARTQIDGTTTHDQMLRDLLKIIR